MLSRNTDRVKCVDATLRNRREICLKFGEVYDVEDISADGERVRVILNGRPCLGWYSASRFRAVDVAR